MTLRKRIETGQGRDALFLARAETRSAFLLIFSLLALTATGAQEGTKRGSRAADEALPPDAHELKIGESAPDFSLPGVDGKTWHLADFQKAKVLMVVFLSNHCPYSHAAETRLLPLASEMKSRGLEVVAINPNHPDAVRIDELGYSKYTDSFEEMKLYSKEARFTFPYLYDGETQATAKAYGCLATPHVFLFDQQRKLRYKGRFDDSRFAEANTVTSPDARKAVEAMLAGQPPPLAETRVMGCSTKWLSNKTERDRAEEQWNHTPITLETIDASAVGALVRNPTTKLRLFNVWATWCAPCVKEFPNLVSLSRRMSNRDFEVITVSVDEPKDRDKVLAFLERQHAAASNRLQRSLKTEGRKTNNYLFTGANTEALLKELDPEAPGPVPHTVLVAPGGKVIYRHTGEFDPADLNATIIDQMGAFYEK